VNVYTQSTGDWFRDGQFIARGYSGHDADGVQGKNNPSEEAHRSHGPIPRGLWKIAEDPAPSSEQGPHGPFVMHLYPLPGTETFGRSGFLIHGDMADPRLAGTASLGCIILPREVRESIWASGDRMLSVIASPGDTPPIC